jgi:hypothetical protein
MKRARASFDARQTVSGFVSYELPMGAIRAPAHPRLAAQFAVHRFRRLAGLLLAGTNVSGTGENQDRPDLVGDPFANVPVLTGTKAV